MIKYVLDLITKKDEYMQYIVLYIRSCFCKHDWKYEEVMGSESFF